MIKVNYFVSVANLVSKPLLRDYNELEKLQSSPKGIVNFVQRAINRTKDIISQELEGKVNIIWAEQGYDHKLVLQNNEIALIVKPLDGIVDFARSFPDFGFLLYYLHPTNPCAVIALPAYNKIVFSQKSSGVFLEDASGITRKVRISQPIIANPRMIISNVEDRSTVTDVYNQYLSAEGKNSIYGALAKGSFKHFNSSLCGIVSFLMSKADMFISDSEGLLQDAERLLVQEAHGFVYKTENSVSVYTG